MKKKLPSDISTSQSIKVLVVEDSEDDVLLIMRELKKGGYHPEYDRIETADAMTKAIREKEWDFILCDYNMPNFSAPAALLLLHEEHIDIPVIIVSGTIGEETAVEHAFRRPGLYHERQLFSFLPGYRPRTGISKIRKKQKETETQKKAALEEIEKNKGTLYDVNVVKACLRIFREKGYKLIQV